MILIEVFPLLRLSFFFFFHRTDQSQTLKNFFNFTEFIYFSLRKSPEGREAISNRPFFRLRLVHTKKRKKSTKRQTEEEKKWAINKCLGLHGWAVRLWVGRSRLGQFAGFLSRTMLTSDDVDDARCSKYVNNISLISCGKHETSLVNKSHQDCPGLIEISIKVGQHSFIL